MTQSKHKVLIKIINLGNRFHLLDKMSDKLYLKLRFYARIGKRLDLKSPKTFNEKMQWLKLYDRNPNYTMMVDKYEAKKYVADLIGEEYIIPTLGVWDRFEDINFDTLPNEFVLKCTHDSGGLVIVKDKSELNMNAAKEKINKSLSQNYYFRGREWPYKNVKPRIIAEKYMMNCNDTSLIDYKFYCFNGKAEYLYVSEGLEDHSTAKISFYDMNFDEAPFKRTDFEPFKEKPQKPINFEKMKILAEKLSENIAFLRVDFYEINGKIYFGELTFSPCSGFMPFEPIEWDYKLGELIKLPKRCER